MESHNEYNTTYTYLTEDEVVGANTAQKISASVIVMRKRSLTWKNASDADKAIKADNSTIQNTSKAPEAIPNYTMASSSRDGSGTPPGPPMFRQGFRNHNRFNSNFEMNRLRTQLLQTQHDLAVECNKNANMQKDIQSRTDAVIQPLIMNLFHQQMDMDKLKAEVRKREIDVEMREAKVSRFEQFFSSGQKIMFSEVRKIDAEMAQLQLDHAWEQGKLEATATYKHAQANADEQIAHAKAQKEHLAHIQDNFNAHAREELENDIRHKVWEEIHEEIADVEHLKGYRDGVKSGRAESTKAAKEEGFLQGYKAAQTAQKLLTSVREGSISINDPALEFLFNPDHPDNLFNRGMQIGRQEANAPNTKSVRDDHVTKENSNTKQTGKSPFANGHADDSVFNCTTHRINHNHEYAMHLIAQSKAIENKKESHTGDLIDFNDQL